MGNLRVPSDDSAATELEHELRYYGIWNKGLNEVFHPNSSGKLKPSTAQLQAISTKVILDAIRWEELIFPKLIEEAKQGNSMLYFCLQPKKGRDTLCRMLEVYLEHWRQHCCTATDRLAYIELSDMKWAIRFHNIYRNIAALYGLYVVEYSWDDLRLTKENVHHYRIYWAL